MTIRERFSRIRKKVLKADAQNDVDSENEEFIKHEREGDERRHRRFLEKGETIRSTEVSDEVKTQEAGDEADMTPVRADAVVIDNKRRETHRERADRIGNKVADKIEGGVSTVQRYSRKANRISNNVMLRKEEAESRIHKERKRTGEPVLSAASHDLNVNWDFVLSKNRPVAPAKPKIGADPLLAFYGSSSKQIRKPDSPKDDPLMRMYGAGKPQQTKKKGDDPLLSLYKMGGSNGKKKKGPDPLLNLYKLPSGKKGKGLFNV